ncbi:putative membrane protein [Saccharomonospora amisosensis]|uniref:Putative membrane protein n=1 Tax=Saccharomonospora amisosensis TaxID=1128677 RepID=A0A7X5ZR06_9PSEU|nr:SHOCT domain-containing protein [Saccharomonospora amisosensis]NIJ11830.1 putative membrane protein [Saccharomonospora amisosensis]
MPYWDHGYWDGGWVGGLLMLLSMVLLWGGVITVVVILVRRFAGHGGSRGEGGEGRDGYGSALRILDERYARGEIDEEEYERRRTRLRG